MAKVGAIARAWGDLADTMKKRGAATVAELDPGLVEKAALELWIIRRTGRWSERGAVARCPPAPVRVNERRIWVARVASSSLLDGRRARERA